MVASIAFSEEELRDYAARAGLGFQFVVKEAFLFEMLETLEDYGFVLKGGTAINKVYLPGHQRFSEDLDYDTDQSKESVKKIMLKTGWKVKREFFTKNAIGFQLAYEFGRIKDTIKADFAFSVKGDFEKAKLVSDFLPISKRADVYTFNVLNAQKEGAFEDRKEWKDLYDLYWMKNLHKSRFKVCNKVRFNAALNEINVPKTANSFIPIQKRVNWEEVLENMKGSASVE
jgi:predicted nucleotidyltransferase component of viral defense system